jgi:hypothetical protein
MSLGVHFALDDELAGRLLAADGNDEVMALIEEIEEELDADHCDSDKAWDAIHRSLTDGCLAADNGSYPLNALILGGHQLLEDADYTVSYLPREQVREVAAAVGLVDRPRLRAGYLTIEAHDYAYADLSDEDFDYTWSNFLDIVAFFDRAAQAGHHVIFTVDA